MIRLHNTKTRQIEDFNPIKPDKVEMYHCGPTVYAQAHLGNLMPYIHWDVLRRLFEHLDYEVNQVMNFTDIGHIVADQEVGNDKMLNALKAEGLELSIENLQSHGQKIADLYLDDMDSLNILQPNHLPFASKHISEDIEIIKKLEARELTYQNDDGIFLDTSKLKNYDAFKVHGDLDPDHARLAKSINKKNPRDFALWKFSDQDSDIGWDSPWGLGFPGWHIECSAMSWKYLGENFDIHTGGIEHISIHHTNEIAQSENAFETEMVNYWLHNNHLKLNGEKISKSDGNVVYLDELEARGFHPIDYRYLILTAHYRSEANLTWEALRGARQARKKFAKLFQELDLAGKEININDNHIFETLLDQVKNDLNNANAIGLANKHLDDKNAEVIYYFLNNILGLTFTDLNYLFEPIKNPSPEVTRLLNGRKEARLSGAYQKSDQIRDKLSDLGYQVVDQDNKQVLYHAD